MKKFYLLLIFSIVFCSLIYTMEKPVTREKALQAYWDVAFLFDQKRDIPYEDYELGMRFSIPHLDFVQNHSHNPLVNAVMKGDYNFTKFLLEHGAKPTFRGIDQLNGYDALRLKNGPIMNNPDQIAALINLLNSYLKKGEKYTRYPLEGMNSNYLTKSELEELEKMAKKVVEVRGSEDTKAINRLNGIRAIKHFIANIK